jgi:hypothetical protein
LGYLNDLWKFNPSAGEWTWVSGSNMVQYYYVSGSYGQAGVYGVMNTPAPANVPGSRNSAVSWTDANGNLQLFSGWGLGEIGLAGSLDDLWEFNPSTAERTWIGGGDNVNGLIPVYGAEGTPAATNIPGARSEATGSINSSGKFWLFGGSGLVSASIGYLNDLWEFDPSTREWEWIGGSSGAGQPGVYGTLGTPSATNIPGGRDCASCLDRQLWQPLVLRRE